MTLAKALAGGIPIGAMLRREDVASALTPGTHGSTFGGNAVRDLGGAGHADDDHRATSSPTAPPSVGRELTDALRALQAKLPVITRGARQGLPDRHRARRARPARSWTPAASAACSS